MSSERRWNYHVPVMVREVVEYLRPQRGGSYFDGTVGGGGHAEAILDANPEARVTGVDRDAEALSAAAVRLARFGERVDIARGTYAEAAVQSDEPLSGALLDLGVSSRQIDEDERGFSFRPGVRLDMRMNVTADAPSAADLLNELSREELADLFWRYGEERKSRRLAAAIVRQREERPFESSDDLVPVIGRALGRRAGVKDKARLFQALRITVNDELGELERALPALRMRLEDDGTMVVLAYHSLEDRIVKHTFREWSTDCICPPIFPVCRCEHEKTGDVLTRRPVRPRAEEVEANPRARSARLRAWRKAA